MNYCFQKNTAVLSDGDWVHWVGLKDLPVAAFSFSRAVGVATSNRSIVVSLSDAAEGTPQTATESMVGAIMVIGISEGTSSDFFDDIGQREALLLQRNRMVNVLEAEIF